MTTLILYFSIVAICFFGIPAILNSVVSFGFILVTKSVLVSTTISSFLTWLLLSFLWKLISKENIPIAALLLSFAAFLGYCLINQRKFTENAKISIGGQLIGIIIFIIFYLIKVPTISWY